MKKYLFLATAIATASLFTGCSNNEYVGDQPEAFNGTDGAIVFSMGKANTTRVQSIGSDAAGKLNKQFWVYGWKTNSHSGTPLVFNNYKVEYQGGASSSNTKGWEYVGITIPGASPSQTQTIKYWDYSADHYDFEAYSYNSSTNSSPERGVTKQTAGNDYGLEAGDYEVKIENNIEDLYFAQKKTVSKSITTGEDKYGASVKLTFKSVLSKIRVGFYETIPGYSVKIENFYKPTSNSDATDFDNGNPVPGNFVAWCPNKAANHEHPFVVNYDSNGTPAVTKVWNGNDKYISFDGTDGNTYTLNPELTLGSNLKKDKVIGDSYSKVTWDRLVVNTTNPDYTYFIPQNQLGNDQVQPMKIKVDYTLTSTDGSKEEIHVKGATAIVPAEYLMWKPNTAYSYVFKISDNTNGTTGTPGTPSDPVGLYPITFDAVVTEMEKNDYLTTVSDLSITATQGKQFAEADKAAFNTDQEIKVKVMRYDDHGAASDITYLFTSNQTDYQFSAAFVSGKTYDYNKSQEDNLNGQTLDSKNHADGNNYITLEGKSAGFWIVKVTYKAGNETIIKYAVLKVGTETTPPSQEGGQG